MGKFDLGRGLIEGGRRYNSCAHIIIIRHVKPPDEQDIPANSRSSRVQPCLDIILDPLTRNEPILNLQAPDTFEFTGVGDDEDRADGTRMSGN